MKTKSLIAIIVIAIIIVGGYLAFKNYFQNTNIACTLEAKICPDGSSVGRTGPNCEFAECPKITENIYQNDEYGFRLTFPETWQGYTVQNQTWEGRLVDTGEIKYSGPEILFKNPQTTAQQNYQDIPIMIFTKEQWQLVLEETLAVSAAPVGPAKVGENAKYVFATPPRWYGFTDAIGWQEAIDIVKTFQTF